MANFHIRAKGFFLTYPQCPLTKDALQTSLLEKLGGEPLVKWMLICQERHQDGNLHLHTCFQLNDPKDVKRADFFDIQGFHPNVQTMKNPPKAIAYCKKTDKEPLMMGEVPNKETTHQSKKNDLVAQLILDGATAQTLLTDHAGFVLQHKRKIEEFENFAKRIKERESKAKWLGGIRFKTFNSEHDAVCGWLEKNIMRQRDFKSPQLLVSAPHNMNKTSLVNMLEKYLRIYYPPQTENYYDFYDDNEFDLVVFDEFTGIKKPHFING